MEEELPPAPDPLRDFHQRTPMEEQPAVMTIAEVAAYLRIPRGSAYKLAQQGRIPGRKVGRHWRFRREVVDKWLDARSDPSARLR